MALSNYKLEPRREIIESGVGLCALLSLCLIAGTFATWFSNRVNAYTRDPWWGDFLGGVACLVVGFFACWGIAAAILYGSHSLGESVCNAFQKHGIYLRPRIRRTISYTGRIVEHKE